MIHDTSAPCKFAVQLTPFFVFVFIHDDFTGSHSSSIRQSEINVNLRLDSLWVDAAEVLLDRPDTTSANGVARPGIRALSGTRHPFGLP